MSFLLRQVLEGAVVQFVSSYKRKEAYFLLPLTHVHIGILDVRGEVMIQRKLILQ